MNETTIATMDETLLAAWQRAMGPVRFIGGPLDGQERPAFLSNRFEVSALEEVRRNAYTGMWEETVFSRCVYERMETNRNIAFWRPSLSTGVWYQ